MQAAIDVGSNTVRMLVGDVAGGRVRPGRYERRITRLKGGQTAKGLAPESAERTLSALRDVVAIAGIYNVETIFGVGTEALRAAADGEEFAQRIRRELGIPFRIISGEEEAHLSASGVLAAIDPVPAAAVIVDIGGGSTEIVVTAGEDVLAQYSFPLGVVGLAEMANVEMQRSSIAACISAATSRFQDEGLAPLLGDPSTVLVGTAGTVTTLAAMDLGMTAYDGERVNNHRMTRARIDRLADRLDALSVPEREDLPGMEKGRGDLIVPGIRILLSIMNAVSRTELIASDSGLLEGLLLRMAGRPQDIDN